MCIYRPWSDNHQMRGWIRRPILWWLSESWFSCYDWHWKPIILTSIVIEVLSSTTVEKMLVAWANMWIGLSRLDWTLSPKQVPFSRGNCISNASNTNCGYFFIEIWTLVRKWMLMQLLRSWLKPHKDVGSTSATSVSILLLIYYVNTSVNALYTFKSFLSLLSPWTYVTKKKNLTSVII
jgi:hypothetical protein